MRSNKNAKAVITTLAVLVLVDYWREWKGLKRVAEFFTHCKDDSPDAAKS